MATIPHGQPPFLGTHRAASIVATNAAIAAGSMAFTIGSTIIRAEDGVVLTLQGVGPEAQFSEAITDLSAVVKKADLATADGAAAMGTPEGTAQAALERRALSVFSTVQLRALSGTKHGTRIAMQQYHNNVMLPRPTGGGDLYVDRNDTTTPDDGAVTFIMADGARAKRRLNGRAWASWWGTYGDGVTSDSAQIQLAGAFAGDKKLKLCFDPEDTHLFTSSVTFSKRVNAASVSVESLLGSTTLDGSGLIDGETMIYMDAGRSKVQGFRFLGKGRAVDAICMGRLVGSDFLVAHSGTVAACEFVATRQSIRADYACHGRVHSCKFEAVQKGVVLDKTANTWKIEKCVAFNSLASYSHSFLHVIHADQVTVRDLWSELGSAPVFVGERFSNVRFGSCWLEHLAAGNAQPLFIVNGDAALNSFGLIVEDSDVITNHAVIAKLTNIQSMEMRNARVTGLSPSFGTAIYHRIECDNVGVVRLRDCFSEYPDNPSSLVNRIEVINAERVDRDDQDPNLVPREFFNQVFDSSFKVGSNFVKESGDVVITQDLTTGVHAPSSMKMAFGAAGSGRGRTAAAVTPVAGQYVRLTCWMKTDMPDGKFVTIKQRVAGITGGLTRIRSLTREWRRFDLTWQVPAGAGGYYYPYFVEDHGTAVSPYAYNVWVADLMFVVSDAFIPRLPYAMNNSITAPMRIGTGVNVTEHTLMGRRVSHGAAAPTAGERKKGDFQYVDAPVVGGPMGFVTVADGDPGTQAPFGIIGATRAAAQTDSAAAPTQAEFNALLAKLRSAGLMAP